MALVITVRSDSGIGGPLPRGVRGGGGGAAGSVFGENTQDLIIHELKLVMKLGMNKLQIADENEGASLGGVILDSS